MAGLVKRAARSAVAALAIRSRLWPIFPKGQGLVLRYHRVTDCRLKPQVPLAVTAEEFEGQLRFLAARCSVMMAGEMAAALAEGKPLPPNAVAITFDDGYEDNCSAALPLLKSNGLKATFFVTAGWIGTQNVMWWDRLHDYVRQAAAMGARPIDYEDLPQPVAAALAAGGASLERNLAMALRGLPLSPEETDAVVERIAGCLGADVADPAPYRPMSWDQVRELHKAGMEIGSHTMLHARLAAVPVERAFTELEQSKQTIGRELGASISLVAYPGGSYNRDVIDLVQEAGYAAAFTTDSGPVRPGDDPFSLRRIGVWAGGYRGVFGGFSPSVFGLQLGRLARPAGGNLKSET